MIALSLSSQSLFVCLSLCLSLSISIFISLSLSSSIPLPLPLSLSIPPSHSPSPIPLFLSLCLSLSLPISLPLFLPLPLPLSLHHYPSLPLSFSLSLSFSSSLPVPLFLSPSPHLSLSLPISLALSPPLSLCPTYAPDSGARVTHDSVATGYCPSSSTSSFLVSIVVPSNNQGAAFLSSSCSRCTLCSQTTKARPSSHHPVPDARCAVKQPRRGLPLVILFPMHVVQSNNQGAAFLSSSCSRCTLCSQTTKARPSSRHPVPDARCAVKQPRRGLPLVILFPMHVVQSNNQGAAFLSSSCSRCTLCSQTTKARPSSHHPLPDARCAVKQPRRGLPLVILFPMHVVQSNNQGAAFLSSSSSRCTCAIFGRGLG